MVLDVGQSTGVLAGGVLGLTHGLFEVRISGLILGVNGHIVIPCRAVDGGHGQRYEERIAGGGHVFRDASLHNEIQALLHIGSRSVAGDIRFGHGHAAVLHSGLQRIFDSGGIGNQRSGQFVVEHIAGEVVDTALSLVSVCAGQTDGRQNGDASITVVEAIQHAHLTLALHHFIVHGDVGHAEVCELYALNGVLAQLVDNRVVMQAGGNVGLRVPHAVRAGLGDVVLIDAQRCFLAGVDGRLGKYRGDEAQSHNSGHEQREHAMDLFHLVVSFIKLDFLQK